MLPSPLARGRAIRATIAAMLLVTLITLVTTPAAAAVRGRMTPDTTRSGHLISVKDSPGYVPLVDPESTADILGHRMNASLVSVPFHGGARSLDALGRSIVRGLHVNSVDSLRALCVTGDEFRDVLWPEFPQSRPALGLNWQDAWVILEARMHAGCSHAIRDYGGHWYDSMTLEADSVLQCRNFTLYTRITLTARNDEGHVQKMHWLRGVVARKGHFKIYSTED